MAILYKRYGRLDIAFNNAGIEGTFGPITDLTQDDVNRAVSINLKGTWLAIKHQVAAMRTAGNGGAIVNTS